MKLFGRGEPERVRHLKGGTKAVSVGIRRGRGGGQRSSGATPTAALDGVLPAEGSVLLDVLQRFKRGALRDEPSSESRDTDKRERR